MDKRPFTVTLHYNTGRIVHTLENGDSDNKQYNLIMATGR